MTTIFSEIPEEEKQSSVFTLNFGEPSPHMPEERRFDPVIRLRTLMHSRPYLHAYETPNVTSQISTIEDALTGTGNSTENSPAPTIRGFAWGGDELNPADYNGFLTCANIPANHERHLPIEQVWDQMMVFVIKESQLSLDKHRERIPRGDADEIQVAIAEAAAYREQFTEELSTGRNRLLTVLGILDIDGQDYGSAVNNLGRNTSFQDILTSAGRALAFDIQYGNYEPSINPRLFPNPQEASNQLSRLEREIARVYDKDSFEEVVQEMGILLEVRGKTRKALQEYVSAGCPLCGGGLSAGSAAGVHYCENVTAHKEPLKRYAEVPSIELYRNNTEVKVLNQLQTQSGHVLGYAAVSKNEYKTSGLALALYGNTAPPLADDIVVVSNLYGTDIGHKIKHGHDGKTPFDYYEVKDFSTQEN